MELEGQLTSFTSFNRICDAIVVIDGGTDVTTVAGPYTADIHSTTTIGYSAAGWTVDQYKGYLVKITSGTYNFGRTEQYDPGKEALVAYSDNSLV